MKMWIIRPLLVGSCCLLVAFVVTAGEPRESGKVAVKETSLPGKVVGLVVTDSAELIRNKNQRLPAGAVVFTQGENDSRCFYLPGGKKPQIGGLFLRVGESGTNRKRFNNLSLASESGVKAMGIQGPITLVELEVNAGLGSSGSEPFLASQIRTLEGSAEYPLRTARVLETLQAHFRAHVRAQKPEMESLYSQIERKVLQTAKPNAPRLSHDHMQATWLPDTKQLRIHLSQEWVNQQSRRVKVTSEKQPTSDLQSKPPELEVDRGIAYGVRVGVTYTVSRRGEVEKASQEAATSFQKPLKGKIHIVKPGTLASGRKTP